MMLTKTQFWESICNEAKENQRKIREGATNIAAVLIVACTIVGSITFPILGTIVGFALGVLTGSVPIFLIRDSRIYNRIESLSTYEKRMVMKAISRTYPNLTLALVSEILENGIFSDLLDQIDTRRGVKRAKKSTE